MAPVVLIAGAAATGIYATFKHNSEHIKAVSGQKYESVTGRSAENDGGDVNNAFGAVASKGKNLAQSFSSGYAVGKNPELAAEGAHPRAFDDTQGSSTQYSQPHDPFQV
jgi:hypothetical protein